MPEVLRTIGMIFGAMLLLVLFIGGIVGLAIWHMNYSDTKRRQQLSLEDESIKDINQR